MTETRRRALCACLLAVALVTAALLLPAGAVPASAHPRPPGASVTQLLAASGAQASAADDDDHAHDHADGSHEHSVAEDSVVRSAEEAAARGDDAAAANAVSVPTGFSDNEVITNITEATSVAFAPDGTAFIALKTGEIKSFDYDASTSSFESNATATNFANLLTEVHNYHDRGLTGIVTDPQFGTAGHDFVYVSYSYDRDPRDNPPVVPRWGTPGDSYDNCPNPADATHDGCVGMMRVSRLTAERTTYGWTMAAGSEVPLLTNACFQFGNPCGDPLDEGGALRSQDYRTSGDPLGIGGSVFRIDPVNGLTPTQSTANQWLVAYGQRNPWRLTFRPGTNQLWSADVGASAWEEINRKVDGTATGTPSNRGWPCYEGTYSGSERNPGWDALDKPVCENLYAAGVGAVDKPWFSYQTRGGLLTPGENCASSTSSVSGVAFGSQASNYPAEYKGALFFSDYARSCVWRLGKDANGDPDPTKVTPFVQAADTPVQLKIGPGNDLYYVDYGLDAQGAVVENAAGIHRITYAGAGNAAPTARITTTGSTTGATPLTVGFSGSTSTDPDGDTLTYSWDLAGDGAYTTPSTNPSTSYTYSSPGTYNVGLRVNDGHGHTATASVTVRAGTPPSITSMTPGASFTWTVGQAIAFAGTATDAEDGTLPASAFKWDLAIRHCPSDVCHTHPLTGVTGQRSGSFTAPDHEYPSHLLLTLTVTDSDGLTAAQTVRIDPKTVPLTFASNPAGAGVTVQSADHVAPYSETFLQNSAFTAVAAPTVVSGGETWAFGSWSNGGARSQQLAAPAAATTYTATYTRPALTVTPSRTTGSAPLTVTYTASATNPAGSTGVTYAWDTDGDGDFDDATGASTSVTWTTSGSKVVRARATDSRRATDTASSTVVVGTNAAPTARIATSPSPASGPSPLAVGFDATTSTDPDGDTLTYAWDLDGDGDYDDSTSPTPSRTYTVGATTVRLRVSDGTSSSATSVPVTSTDTAPSVTRVTTYPAGGFSVGQTLGFDASATDPQQELANSAYSFVMERQDCDSGCPRQVVQRWTGVQNGQFTVPAMPWPSHLYLTATATDAQGATGSRTVRIDPVPATLTVTTRKGVAVTVNGVKATGPITLVAGSVVRLEAPKRVKRKGKRWVFVKWSDGGERVHDVVVGPEGLGVKAIYKRKR